MAFQLSEEGKAFVKKQLTRFEVRESAIIPCLYRVQDENNGWVSPEAIDHLSNLMDLPQSRIQEVMKFYTMFNQEPRGKYHVQVCATLTCGMLGARELCTSLMKANGVENHGEVSKDGRFSFSHVECLGSCDTAPVMQINREPYNEGLNEEKAMKILKELK